MHDVLSLGFRLLSVQRFAAERPRFSAVRSSRLLAGALLEELLEVLNSEPSITNDAAHCVLIDRVMTWNRQNSTAITRHNVLALVDDLKTRSFQSPDGPEVINSWKLRHD
jgi:hypothetical protein